MIIILAFILQPDVDMQWRLVNYLPEVGNCKINFSTAIASYITAVYQHLNDELDGYTPGETPVRKRKSTQTPRRAHNNPLTQNTVQFARQLITGELAQKLFLIVQRLNKKYPSGIPSSNPQGGVYKGPLLNSPGKPALEFVKAIYRVSRPIIAIGKLKILSSKYHYIIDNLKINVSLIFQ